MCARSGTEKPSPTFDTLGERRRERNKENFTSLSDEGKLKLLEIGCCAHAK